MQSNKVEKKVSSHKERSREKNVNIQTPVIKRTSRNKEEYEKTFSSEKKGQKGQTSKKSIEKLQRPPSITFE